ncbi:hypothetical protein [Agrobacterium sp. NPDC089420]|uniref:hypothetical protein n=1 Tax=Agrobacterium sp. NPDC089420 TaxID=3363918 RepID=UPI00385046F7
MSANDLTIAQALRDPLIRQMLKADKVARSDFATLLWEAADRARNAASASCAIAPPATMTGDEQAA